MQRVNFEQSFALGQMEAFRLMIYDYAPIPLMEYGNYYIQINTKCHYHTI